MKAPAPGRGKPVTPRSTPDIESVSPEAVRATLEGVQKPLATALHEEGFAVTPPLLTPSVTSELREMFDEDRRFRSTVDMARVQFGRGRYRYFEHPLPEVVSTLRRELYAVLAPIANQWSGRLGGSEDTWPASLEDLSRRCREAGQTRPTPLLLRYRPGDYNCLHQDLYGEIHFPLQAVVMLSDPARDFAGGELVLVEQRPRLQSRPMVVPLPHGAAALFPVRERPRPSARGWSRSYVRHGVSEVRAGERFTLGLIFHDAA